MREEYLCWMMGVPANRGRLALPSRHPLCFESLCGRPDTILRDEDRA